MNSQKVSKLVKYLLEGYEVTDQDGRTYLLDENYNLCTKAFDDSGGEHLLNTFYSLKPLVDLSDEVDLDSVTLDVTLNRTIRPKQPLYATKIETPSSSGFIDGPTPDITELMCRAPQYDGEAKFYIVELVPDGDDRKLLSWSEEFGTWLKIRGSGPIARKED